MANYDVGTLLLDLQVYGQAEFEQNMGRIEQGIEDADAAGVSFFRNNKAGYGALKSLTLSAAESVDKLTQSYEEGRISSSEYAEGLAVIDRINTAAVRSSGTLKKSVVDVSAALQSVRAAGDSYEAVFDRAIGQTDRLFAAIAAGKVSTNEAARALSDARREVMNFSSSLDESSDEAARTYDLALALGAAMTDLSNGTQNDGLLSQLRGIREGALAARQAIEPLETITLDEPDIDLSELERAGELHENQLELIEEKTRREREYRAEVERTNAVQGERDADPFRDEPSYVPPAATPPSGGGGGGNRTSARQSRELDSEFMDLERRFTVLQGLQRAGRATTDELVEGLSDLRAEALAVADSLGESSECYARFVELAGRAGVAEMRPGSDWDEKATEDKIKALENSLKTLESRYQSGELDAGQYRVALRELAGEAGMAATAFAEASNERTRLEGVVGRATKVAFSLDTDDLESSIRTVENRFKSLQGLFDSGQIDAAEYGTRLRALAREALAASGAFEQATAERSRLEAVAGRASKAAVQLDTQAAEEGVRGLENRFRSLEGRFAGGTLELAEYRDELALLSREAQILGDAFEGASAERARLDALSGRATKTVFTLDTDDLDGEIRTVENRLKSLTGLFESGQIDAADYGTRLRALAGDALAAAGAFDEATAERSRLEAVAGRATQAAFKLDTQGAEEGVRRLENRYKSLEGLYNSGKIGLTEYRDALSALAREAQVVGAAFDAASNERARLDALSGRSVKTAFTLDTDDLEGQIRTVENRFTSLQGLFESGQLGAAEYGTRLRALAGDALGAAGAFDEATRERSRLEAVAGRATQAAFKLDTKESEDGVRRLETRLRGITGLFNAGELTVDEYRESLSALKTEALAASEAAFDVALKGRLQAVAGGSGREVARLDESDTEQGIREVENALKRASAEFAQDGDVERYRAALAEVATQADRTAQAFDATSTEATRLSAVSGRVAEALARLSADRVADDYAALNLRVAQAEQGFAKGRLSLAQYREQLEAVAQAALRAAAATDDVQNASRFEGLAARAVKLQDTRAPDRSFGSVDAEMAVYERRLTIIDALHRAGQTSSVEKVKAYGY